MKLYNLNLYQNDNLIVYCFMQTEASNAKEAMKIFKKGISPKNYRGKELKELKRNYAGLKMKAQERKW